MSRRKPEVGKSQHITRHSRTPSGSWERQPKVAEAVTGVAAQCGLLALPTVR